MNHVSTLTVNSFNELSFKKQLNKASEIAIISTQCFQQNFYNSLNKELDNQQLTDQDAFRNNYRTIDYLHGLYNLQGKLMSRYLYMKNCMCNIC